MKYRIIALDLDDTLLREDLSISEYTRHLIIKAQQAGVRVVLASGRPTAAMTKYARLLELDKYNGYIMSFNGSVVTCCNTKRELFKYALPVEKIKKLYDASRKHNLHFHTYVGDDIVTQKHNEYTAIEGSLTGLPVREVDDIVTHVTEDPIKVLMLEHPEYLKLAAVKLAQDFGNDMNVSISKPYFLEFTDKSADKGAALRNLAERLGVDQHEVIAVGDSYNDLSMINYAGVGVAMANGVPEVKAAADFVTASNHENGVAVVIEKFILNGNNAY